MLAFLIVENYYLSEVGQVNIVELNEPSVGDTES